MLVFKLAQHFHVGGKPRLVLFPALQAELDKEHFRQLPRGIDVEGDAAKLMDTRGEVGENAFELRVQLFEPALVHAKARLFHRVKHGDERHFHVAVNVVHALGAHALLGDLFEPKDRAGGAGIVYPEGKASLGKRLIGAVCVVQPGKEHGVVVRAFQANSVPAQSAHERLFVIDGLFHALVFEHAAQRLEHARIFQALVKEGASLAYHRAFAAAQSESYPAVQRKSHLSRRADTGDELLKRVLVFERDYLLLDPLRFRAHGQAVGYLDQPQLEQFLARRGGERQTQSRLFKAHGKS